MLDLPLISEKLINKLEDINRKELHDLHVVLLPDFFVDRLITFNEFDTVFTKIKEIYTQGGGNIPGVPQTIIQGGNSANTALALSKLGISSHLICRTDKLGLHLLEYFLLRNGVDISHVKTDGKLAMTTAFEFTNNHANVMIGDPGSVSDFSYDFLDEKDKDLISGSDMICVTTWNLNQKGTELVKNVFEYAKRNNVKTFFDTGDPSPKKKEIPDLIKNVLTDKNLDILGLNENELTYYSNIKTNTQDEIVNAATLLKNKINARIDLHTKDFALTINKKSTIIPTLNLKKIYRSTGAGDTWNAGDIFAELLDFDDDERLLFANSLAGKYISSIEPVHPTLDDIIQFIPTIRKNLSYTD